MRLNECESSHSSGSPSRSRVRHAHRFAQGEPPACRSLECSLDPTSLDPATPDDGRDLPCAPRRALPQPFPARRPSQRGRQRSRRGRSRKPLARGVRVPRHEPVWRTRLASGSPCERIAASRRRRCRTLRGRLRTERRGPGACRVGRPGRAVRPRHERWLLDGRRRSRCGRRHTHGVARRAHRDRQHGRGSAPVAAARDRRDRRRLDPPRVRLAAIHAATTARPGARRVQVTRLLPA